MMPTWTDRWTRVMKMIMLITGGMMQKILTKQMMMIFLLIRTLTGTQIHILYLDMKYGNHVLNKGQTRSPSFYVQCPTSHVWCLMSKVPCLAEAEDPDNSWFIGAWLWSSSILSHKKLKLKAFLGLFTCLICTSIY